MLAIVSNYCISGNTFHVLHFVTWRYSVQDSVLVRVWRKYDATRWRRRGSKKTTQKLLLLICPKWKWAILGQHFSRHCTSRMKWNLLIQACNLKRQLFDSIWLHSICGKCCLRPSVFHQLSTLSRNSNFRTEVGKSYLFIVSLVLQFPLHVQL